MLLRGMHNLPLTNQGRWEVVTSEDNANNDVNDNVDHNDDDDGDKSMILILSLPFLVRPCASEWIL